MPRRRPPGAGPGLRSTTALLAILLVLPWIATAAQQQQSPDNPHKRSPNEEAYLDAFTPPKPRKAPKGRPGNASKRDPYTPLISQNERAVATKVSSAPADAAVRAPPARNAASSPGGLAAKSARSLQDWEVEDFVLLATVDGRIHARDRYNGDEIWFLDLGKPMLETIYNNNNSKRDSNPQNKPFIWIVEPKEDGALYILTPGPHPVLQSLGMTVKQLTEDMAPYSSNDPPVVYTADKKNVMLVVDARTGEVTKSFSSGGSVILDTESCVPQAPEHSPRYFDSKERECRGLFNIGRTEYVVSIDNKNTGENICTIKYSEWTPNNRDRDLQAQYLETMDNQYIYSRYDGHAIAYDHNRPKRLAKRPVFEQKLSSPVVRVFDVARPNDDEDPEPALVLLPQPPGPAFLEDKARNVWLNTTEAGSWYALSEVNYPAVTDRAPQALCYSPEWTNNELLNLDGPHYLPDRIGLVGVHILDHRGEVRTNVPRLDGPRQSEDPIVPIPKLPVHPIYEPPEQEPPSRTTLWPIVIALVCLLVSVPGWKYSVNHPAMLNSLRSHLSRFIAGGKTEALPIETPAAPQLEQVVAEEPKEPEVSPPTVDSTTPEPAVEHTFPDNRTETEPEKKVVRFTIPEDDEEDLEPLSRTTTAEQISPAEDVEKNGVSGQANDGSPDLNSIEGGAPASTPTKKKKTHRGKRGGQKKPRKPKDEDEVDRIVNAAKELDQTPTLHPDEVTVNGDDMQDVSNVKRIGKLTIDFDRLLGNGSGGTFVFEGKWNVSACC